jgi:hypothetical protein
VPDVAALNVVISADTKDLEAGVARAEKSVAGLGSAMSSVLTGIGVGVGMKAFDGIVSGFEAAGKAAIGFNSNMEQSTIAFTSMLGSAERRRQHHEGARPDEGRDDGAGRRVESAH